MYCDLDLESFCTYFDYFEYFIFSDEYDKSVETILNILCSDVFHCRDELPKDPFSNGRKPSPVTL